MTVSVCVCLSRVCMFVGPRSYLQKYTSDLYHFFAHVTCGGGLILLWRRRDTLCTSGFMGDVILAHKARQLNVSAHLMEAQPTCSLGLGYKRRVGIPVAGQWTRTHGPTFRAPRGQGLLGRSGPSHRFGSPLTLPVWIRLCRGVGAVARRRREIALNTSERGRGRSDVVGDAPI